MNPQKSSPASRTFLLLGVVIIFIIALVGVLIWSNNRPPQPAGADERGTPLVPTGVKATPQEATPKAANGIAGWEYKSVLISDIVFAPFLGDGQYANPGPHTIALENANPDTIKYLDALGREGWELVAVIGANAKEHDITLLFKRPLRP